MQFDIQKTANLLNKANEIIKLNEQEWRKSGKYFNVFTALGIEQKEVRHSALLAALLDPNGFHGMSDCFLKEFLHRIDFENFPTEDAIVRTEEVIRGGRRLDISIVSKDGKQKIVIENKIYTEDHDNQLSAYLRDLETKESYKLIYLTLNGDEPTEDIGKQKEEIICLSYKNDILEMLENVASARNMLPHPVLEIIRQYILTIKKLTNQGVDRKMDDALKELLLQGDNFETVETVYNQLNDIKFSVLKEFLEYLKQELESEPYNEKVSIKYKDIENLEKAVRGYTSSKANNEKEFMQLSFPILKNETFFIRFSPDGDVWPEIKPEDEHSKPYTTKLWSLLEPSYKNCNEMNFRNPNYEFKKFARKTTDEQKEWVADFVKNLENALKQMEAL